MLIKQKKRHILNGPYLLKVDFLSPKDALCQDCLKATQWFSRRFLNFINVFSLFHYYLPLESGPSFDQTLIPFSQK